MQRFQDSVLIQNPTTGQAVVGYGLTAKVYNAGTNTLATIYSDNGITIWDQNLNPIITDAGGNFFFYAADGRYDITISGLGITSFTKNDIMLDDLASFFGGNYADATGTVDVLAANYPNAPLATLADGYPFNVGLLGNNLTTTPTFAPTLKGVAQAARVIVKYGPANTVIPLEVGDLNGMAQLVYDAPNIRYILTNPANTVFNNVTATGNIVALQAANYNQLMRRDQSEYPWRNRFINSDMSVNQVYGTTAVTPTADTFVTDQFHLGINVASKITAQQVADAPAGLKYSTKLTVAAQYAPAATDFFTLHQSIEGNTIQDFQLGLAGAATILTSVWIKGSVAGTYAVSFRNSANNRSYVGTIAVTTGWSRLSIAFVGDTTGTWLTDTGIGITVALDLGSGSNFNAAAANTWAAGNFLRLASTVTFVNQVVGSTLNITGMQIERGLTGQTVPTTYEYLPYAEQLRRAQRYLPCWNSTGATSWLSSAWCSAAASAIIPLQFPVPTRVPPTAIVISNAAHITFYAAAAFAGSAQAINGNPSTTELSITLTIAGATAGQGGGAYFNNAAGQLYLTGAQL